MDFLLLVVIQLLIISLTVNFLIKTWERYHRERKEAVEEKRINDAEAELILSDKFMLRVEFRVDPLGVRRISRIMNALYVFLLVSMGYPAATRVFMENVSPDVMKLPANSRHDENTIVGLLLNRKIKSDIKSGTLLLGAVIIHLILVALGVFVLNYSLVFFLVIMISLLYLNQQILAYRLAEGYYGTNPYEVREIVEFILEHADKTDFTDGNGKMKLMPDIEAVSQLDSIVKGAVYS